MASELSATIPLDPDLMKSDIEAFVLWKIRDLDTRDLGERDKVVNTLITGADGLILLARCRIESLTQQVEEARVDLEQALSNLPTDIHGYYSDVISRITSLPDREKSIATRIFVWVTFAQRPLSFAEVAEIISFSYSRKAGSGANTISRGLIDKLCLGMIVLHHGVV
jgi:hypothetical protein